MAKVPFDSLIAVSGSITWGAKSLYTLNYDNCGHPKPDAISGRKRRERQKQEMKLQLDAH